MFAAACMSNAHVLFFAVLDQVVSDHPDKIQAVFKAVPELVNLDSHCLELFDGANDKLTVQRAHAIINLLAQPDDVSREAIVSQTFESGHLQKAAWGLLHELQGAKLITAFLRSLTNQAATASSPEAPMVSAQGPQLKGPEERQAESSGLEERDIAGRHEAH